MDSSSTRPPSSTTTTAAAAAAIEKAKNECKFLIEHTLPSLAPSKISPSSKLTLHRLLSSELRFLSSLSPNANPSPNPSSLNIGYLSSILSTIQHPSVHHVSRLCKPLPPPSSFHVDLVCTFALSPAWFFVSDRNPAYVSAPALRSRLLKIRAAARSAVSLRPELVFLVFARGVGDDVAGCLVEEFGAVEVEFGGGRVFEVKIGGELDRVCCEGLLEVGNGERLLGLGDGEFGSLVSLLRPDGELVVNFDTTALVAIVSGISNGGCGRLLEAAEDEMRRRFKSNYEFVIAQVMSELEHPILPELRNVIAGKKGIICESVCSEFKEIVMMCGGPNEKLRADLLNKHLLVVPDKPSERVANLPTTGKIAAKNKIVFGTGDYWHAPTLTANMGFVRAIAQTGMSLYTIDHRPRALTGD